jgi:uncharacterized iron-regulated membrane protein
MSKSFNFWSRKLHRWGAIAFCAPLLIVILSGILLQLKKHVAWVQPETADAGHNRLQVSWQSMLEAVAKIPECEVRSWSDVERLDVRPDRGIAKIQCRNRQEVQVDLASGDVLAVNYRRSDLIEMLHDGSIFGEIVKLGVFLPNAIALLFLWFTGLWLWYLPFRVNRKKHKRRQSLEDSTGATRQGR